MRSGLRMQIDPTEDPWVEKSLYETGAYEAGTVAVLQRFLNVGDTFFDIGANIGVLSLEASRFVGPKGSVHAFEPATDTFNMLTKNIELNTCENIIAQNVALGASCATVTLYKPNRSQASLIQHDKSYKKDQTVHVLTVDQYVTDHNISHVNMMKIDVEGWELEVMHGAAKLLQSKVPPILIVECVRNRQQHDGDVLDLYAHLLDLRSYTIYTLRDRKTTPSPFVEVLSPSDLPLHDNLFCLPKEYFQEEQSTCQIIVARKH